VIDFTEKQIERYARHIILPEVGAEGQSKLLESKVFMIGAGGLGSPVAYYLAAAGVGTIGIADADVVDSSNLQRQIIHNEDRVGMPKVESARETIQALNPDVQVNTYNYFVTEDNIREIIREYDLIIDGCDNFPTRFLVNDACYFEKKPLISGAMFRFEGQVATSTEGCTLLSLPVSGAAAEGAGTFLFRGRHSRRAGWCRGYHPGRGGHQGTAGHRRFSGGQTDDLRCAAHGVEEAEAA